MAPMQKLELDLDSELPTDRAPEQASRSARALATLADGEVWCDSEAPTGVAAERPVLPRPPRAPQV
jgi:hypothetical protein